MEGKNRFFPCPGDPSVSGRLSFQGVGRLRACFWLLTLSLLSSPMLSASENVGEFLGAKDTAHPAWFKESFLDFEEDIAEAAAEGKRLVLYFWQTGCPYCNALVEHNFAQRDIVDAMQAHYSLVGINMWGDREVVQVGGKTFTEKTLAAALKVNYTPTLLFFDENRKVILRLNGYYPPDEFRTALDWAQAGNNSGQSFAEYAASASSTNANPNLNEQDFFERPPHRLATGDREYTAIFFEQPNCRQCDVLHEKVLSQQIVRAQAEKMRAIQLDMWSDALVVTSDGREISARDLAKELKVQFAPTVVFLDASGQEVMRMDGAFKTFHTQGIFRYVNEKAYASEPSFQRYLGALAERFREQGLDVDIWTYDLAVSRDKKAVNIE